ncbi:MAG: hypothetical protein ACI9XC_001371 [Gammaproteobacteria bacterium]|jgi:hypothetical protein
MPVPNTLIIAPPPIQKTKGDIALKFEGAELKSIGLATAIQKVAEENECYFFDAGTITDTSRVDGVHLDEDQHLALGKSIRRGYYTVDFAMLTSGKCVKSIPKKSVQLT